MAEFSTVRHPSRDPEIESLVEALQRREVRFILIGSVAAAAYGVDVQAGDLDIVPDRDEKNLENLIHVLAEIEAAPHGPFGSWVTLDSGESKWIGRPTTAAELAEWRPDPRDIQTFDHLFVTRFGNLDLVPQIRGSYADLRPRARMLSWRGHDLWVAHVDELLAGMTIPRRDQDHDRVLALRQIQRRLQNDRI